jgi:hypothetical protein
LFKIENNQSKRKYIYRGGTIHMVKKAALNKNSVLPLPSYLQVASTATSHTPVMGSHPNTNQPGAPFSGWTVLCEIQRRHCRGDMQRYKLYRVRVVDKGRHEQ